MHVKAFSSGLMHQRSRAPCSTSRDHSALMIKSVYSQARARRALSCRTQAQSQASTTVAPAPTPPQLTPSSDSAPSPSLLPPSDEQLRASFRFLPRQLHVFKELQVAMRSCSQALVALAVGNVVANTVEAGRHSQEAAEEAAVAAGAAAGETAAAVAEAVEKAAAAGGALQPLGFLQELSSSVSLSDVAFCADALVPAALLAYAAETFEQLAANPDEPHVPLAMRGVGRLSLALQQLAWTSGSVGVVVLLEAAAHYPPLVGVASGTCLTLAVARGLALWWVVSAHTSSGEEVSRTLAALRGGANAPYAMGPLERAACWLALGALLQAEPPLHPTNAANTQPAAAGAANTHAAEGGPAAGHGGEGGQEGEEEAQARYAFNEGDEGALRALVEAGNAAGLALGLQVLATAGMGVAEAATQSPEGVSYGILAVQRAISASLLFSSSAAFDKALHNDDGHDDIEHLLEGLGAEHGGMAGLFGGMAVLSWALLMAGAVKVAVPWLLESPLGVVLGEGALHAGAHLLVEVLEAI